MPVIGKKCILSLTLFLVLFLSSCGMYLYDVDDKKSTEGIYVKEVIDGDTVILSTGQSVRLIGINTPETDMPFFEEAKQYLDYLIGDKQVRLEKDISDKDQYGRLLRYIYLDDIFINLEMVKSGFANSFAYPPDIKYHDLFTEAERGARKQSIGLWEKSHLEKIEIHINYDAEGDDRKNLNGEFVLMTNKGTQDISIKGWSIKDSATHLFIFPDYTFQVGETIVLFTGKGTNGGGRFYFNSAKPIWNNDHDTLYLRDAGGLLIEIYQY